MGGKIELAVETENFASVNELIHNTGLPRRLFNFAIKKNKTSIE